MQSSTLLRAFSIAAAAALGVASGATAQAPKSVPLGRPDATFAEPLSSPSGFRALDADRVLVSDNLEGAVALWDFRAGTATPIGRQGGGPGEYGMPGPLFAGGGDTTYMLDMGNRRLLVITPAGGIASATIALNHPSQIPVIPRAVDRQGRVYFDLAGIQMAQLNEMAKTGRAPLLRWDLKTGRTDTVAYVAFPPAAPVGPGEVRMSIGGREPFEARDQWAVLPDGRVGVARATPYRAEWQGAAAPVVGPAVEYQPVRIGTAEKNAWADQATRGIQVIVENGQRRTQRAPRPDINRQQWPETMPPFASPPNPVVASPAGELWVLRTGPANADTRVYDVFDGQGRRARRVTLEGERFVLGFGPGVVFVARRDDDDLVWVERYRIPA
jgi:hypothetical protein